MLPRRLSLALGTVVVLVTGLALLLLLDPGRTGPVTRTAPPDTARPDPPPGPQDEPTPDHPENALLPNMRSTDAYDFQVEGVGNGRVLRFAAALANLGAGPMVVEPLGRRDCRRSQLAVRQVVHRDRDGNGVFDRSRDRSVFTKRSGCMLRHPGHDHWHFDAMASYALRDARTDRVIVSRDKVSFCLRDNERVRRVPTRVRRSWFGDCTAQTRQGISPGWVDVYGADLDGQSLPLPGRRADGRLLCLDLAADPRDRLLETREDDNATSVGVRIRGTQVRRVATHRCS